MFTALVFLLLSTRPDYTAEFISDQGTSIRVDVRQHNPLGLSRPEFSQKLSVCWESSWFCNRSSMGPRYDGRLGGNIYLDASGNLLVAYEFGMVRIDDGLASGTRSVDWFDDTSSRSRDGSLNCSNEPDGPLAVGDTLPSSLYFHELVYVGALRITTVVRDEVFRSKRFSFVPSSEMGERLCSYPFRG